MKRKNMSNWKTITVADLKNSKAAPLIEALAEAALGEGQSDPTGDIIANVTARVRAEIAGCTRNTLDADTTKIPNDLVSLACRLIYVEMAGRCIIALTDDERDQFNKDTRLLERIASCDLPVAEPDTPTETPEVSGGVTTPMINEPSRKFSRENADGI